MERRTVRGCKVFEDDDGISNECWTAVCNALVALRIALGWRGKVWRTVDKRSAAEAGVSFVGVGTGTEARWAEAENLCLIFCNMAVCQQFDGEGGTTSHSFRKRPLVLSLVEALVLEVHPRLRARCLVVFNHRVGHLRVLFTTEAHNSKIRI